MKRFEGRLAVVLFAAVICMGAFSGCKKDKPEDPDLNEGEEYYEEDDYDEYYEEEPYEEESEDFSPESAEFAIGKWYTDGYDETDNWAGSYCLELKEDGTATCVGYRNKDSGYYEVMDEDSVLIIFDECEVDEAEEGFKKVDDFLYTIEMTVKGDDATIKIDAPDVISNLEDGTLHRNVGKPDSSDPFTGKWYTEDYDETDNWANSYCLELKKDGTATCQGYRNRDTGTYEVKGDGKIVITFDFCETDEPDAGWVAAEGYSYTIDMTVDGDDATIKVNSSDTISNLDNGTLHRDPEAGADDEKADRSVKGKAKDGATIMFKTVDFEGNRVTSEEIFKKHEVTMVNVWATWCYWCVTELPELEEINKRLAEKDCAIVGLLGDVEDDSTVDEALEILEENGVTYLNILPWDGATEKDFNMDKGWPTTFFVGRDGKIIGDPIVGAGVDEYEKRIDEILAGK